MTARKITASRVVDSLYLPTRRIQAICLLHQSVEQLLFDFREIVSRTHDGETVRGLVELRFEEIESYLFMVGELAYEARDEMSSFYKDAKVESDAEFEKRQPTKGGA